MTTTRPSTSIDYPLLHLFKNQIQNQTRTQIKTLIEKDFESATEIVKTALTINSEDTINFDLAADILRKIPPALWARLAGSIKKLLLPEEINQLFVMHVKYDKYQAATKILSACGLLTRDTFITAITEGANPVQEAPHYLDCFLELKPEPVQLARLMKLVLMKNIRSDDKKMWRKDVIQPLIHYFTITQSQLTQSVLQEFNTLLTEPQEADFIISNNDITFFEAIKDILVAKASPEGLITAVRQANQCKELEVYLYSNSNKIQKLDKDQFVEMTDILIKKCSKWRNWSLMRLFITQVQQFRELQTSDNLNKLGDVLVRAARAKKTNIVKMLLEINADITKTTHDEQNALDFAEEADDSEMIEMLLKADLKLYSLAQEKKVDQSEIKYAFSSLQIREIFLDHPTHKSISDLCIAHGVSIETILISVKQNSDQSEIKRAADQVLKMKTLNRDLINRTFLEQMRGISQSSVEVLLECGVSFDTLITGITTSDMPNNIIVALKKSLTTKPSSAEFAKLMYCALTKNMHNRNIRSNGWIEKVIQPIMDYFNKDQSQWYFAVMREFSHLFTDHPQEVNYVLHTYDYECLKTMLVSKANFDGLIHTLKRSQNANDIKNYIECAKIEELNLDHEQFIDLTELLIEKSHSLKGWSLIECLVDKVFDIPNLQTPENKDRLGNALLNVAKAMCEDNQESKKMNAIVKKLLQAGVSLTWHFNDTKKTALEFAIEMDNFEMIEMLVMADLKLPLVDEEKKPEEVENKNKKTSYTQPQIDSIFLYSLKHESLRSLILAHYEISADTLIKAISEGYPGDIQQVEACLFDLAETANQKMIDELNAKGAHFVVALLRIQNVNKEERGILLQSQQKFGIAALNTLYSIYSHENVLSLLQDDSHLVYKQFVFDAVRKNNLDAVKILIQKNPLKLAPEKILSLLTQSDGNGDTVLHWAIKNENNEMAKILWNAGVDPEQANHEDKIPADLKGGSLINKLQESSGSRAFDGDANSIRVMANEYWNKKASYGRHSYGRALLFSFLAVIYSARKTDHLTYRQLIQQFHPKTTVLESMKSFVLDVCNNKEIMTQLNALKKKYPPIILVFLAVELISQHESLNTKNLRVGLNQSLTSALLDSKICQDKGQAEKYIKEKTTDAVKLCKTIQPTSKISDQKEEELQVAKADESSDYILAPYVPYACAAYPDQHKDSEGAPSVTSPPRYYRSEPSAPPAPPEFYVYHEPSAPPAPPPALPEFYVYHEPSAPPLALLEAASAKAPGSSSLLSVGMYSPKRVVPEQSVKAEILEGNNTLKALQ